MRKGFDAALTKLKPPAALLTKDGALNRLPRSTAFIGLQQALKVFQEIAGKTGVPGLQEGVKGLTILLDAIQKTSQNSDDMELLAKRIQDLHVMLQKASSGGTLSLAMTDRIDRLSQSWKSTGETAESILSHNYVKRLITRDNDAAAIAGSMSAVSWSIESFLVESIVAFEFALDEHTQYVKHATAQIESKVDAVQSSIQEMKMKLDIYGGLNPPYAIAARFDYNPELVQCLQGTRIEILDEIDQWIIAGVKPPLLEFTPACSSSTATAGSEKRSCIFWIDGLAGSGKTTIAFTIAQRCQNQGILGASFFCSRENADCSNLKLVFTTVAYQLGQFCPEFKNELSRVLKLDPDIVYSGVSYQLEKLLVEPLLAVPTCCGCD